MTIINRRIAVAALAGMLALGTTTLTACGSAIENAVEEAAGNAVGGDVNIDDGNVSVTDSEGNEMSIGEDVSIPDNWPSEIPVFDNGKLVTVVIGSGGSSVNAMWTTDATPEEAAAAYGSALESAGFTKGDVSAAAGMASGDYTGNGYKVTVVTLSADGASSLMVNAEKE